MRIPNNEERLRYNVNDQHLFAKSNGDWAMVLELGYAFHRDIIAKMFLHYMSTGEIAWPNPPKIEQARDQWLNKPNIATDAIETLTGNSVDTDMVLFTSNDTTRQKLADALSKKKIVVAGTWGESFATLTLRAGAYHGLGLRSGHYYSTIKYSSGTDAVTLRDPYGDVHRDGVFELDLVAFTELFAGIHYEQSR